MRGTKTLAFLTAMVSCMTCTAAVHADEDDKQLTASLGLASSDLSVQSWEKDIVIDEGINSVTFLPPDDSKGETTVINGIGMLVIDIKDSYFEEGAITIDSITVDGKELEFDESAMIFGANTGADNSDYRIELFSCFGKTKDTKPFDAAKVTVNENVTVTFTVSKPSPDKRLKAVTGNVVEAVNSKSPKPLTDYKVEISTVEIFDDEVTSDEETTAEETSTDTETTEAETTADEDSSAETPTDEGSTAQESTGDEEVFEFGELIRSVDAAFAPACTVDGDVFTAKLKRGIYDFTISKEGYAARVIKGVTIDTDLAPDALRDIDLRAYGDVNGDGVRNVTDISIVAAYVKKVKNFTDDYQYSVADVTHDDTVNVTDISAIAGDVKGIKEII